MHQGQVGNRTVKFSYLKLEKGQTPLLIGWLEMWHCANYLILVVSIIILTFDFIILWLREYANGQHCFR